MNATSWSSAAASSATSTGSSNPASAALRRDDLVGQPQHVVGQRVGGVDVVPDGRGVIPSVDQEFERQDAASPLAGVSPLPNGTVPSRPRRVPGVQGGPGREDDLAFHRVVGRARGTPRPPCPDPVIEFSRWSVSCATSNSRHGVCLTCRHRRWRAVRAAAPRACFGAVQLVGRR